MYKNRIQLKIKPKINNFIDDHFTGQIVAEECFNGIFNFMVKCNVISINIDDIFKERKNESKFRISMFNCLFLWLMFLLSIAFLLSETLMKLIDNPLIPFDKIKQIFCLISTVLFLVSNFKTDILYEEKRNNLIWLKFIYYLMIDDKMKHKLNNHNYKLLKIIVKVIHFLLIQCAGYFVLPLVIIFYFIFVIASQSIFFLLSSPFIMYGAYVYATSILALISLVYIILIYYILRFNQINAQLRLFHKIHRISPRKFIQIIDEHNELSLSIRRLSLIMNKSVGSLYVLTAVVIDLSIYLLIYTESIYYKVLFFCYFVACINAIFIIDFLLIKVSSSAHQSYNLIYSILKRQTLTYRMKFKVS